MPISFGFDVIGLGQPLVSNVVTAVDVVVVDVVTVVVAILAFSVPALDCIVNEYG